MHLAPQGAFNLGYHQQSARIAAFKCDGFRLNEDEVKKLEVLSFNSRLKPHFDRGRKYAETSFYEIRNENGLKVACGSVLMLYGPFGIQVPNLIEVDEATMKSLFE